MRSLHAISRDIKSDWKNINYAAKPYLDALSQLDSINDNYYFDSAKSIVSYFLANAKAWKGEKARSIKLELKSMM